MSTASASYQLPDLLPLFQDNYELRINKHCRSASLASENWIQTLDFPSTARNGLPDKKLGLLAACCFPTCDLNQLTLVMDLWTLIVVDTETLLRSKQVPALFIQDFRADSKPGFVELTKAHILFKHLSLRLSQLKSSTSESWQQRFSASMSSYMDAKRRGAEHQAEGNRIPLEIDDYIKFRRNLSGIELILDMIEAVEGLELDISFYGEELHALRRVTAEIICLTWDVFSYNIDQSVGNTINIVSLLRSSRKFSLSSAVQQAGTMIRDRITRFKALENALLVKIQTSTYSTDTNASTTPTTSWLWNVVSSSRAPQAKDPGQALTETQAHDIALYTRGLNDLVIGFLNWAYETDMFFGTKGDAVKGFGWVFLLPAYSLTRSST
ncbi:hypothetical protein D9757_003142 [Collybiopsis confluens]|uniref:Terpene synthase n=1 Tax=Collybiopsis confluens TaxID=2823264 RepID=A0A8H5MEX4_9AGAR|nr:hypothetical protein D9757_003142 [Collybiopsis confluens]